MEASNYFDMIDWNTTAITPPPVLSEISSDNLRKAINSTKWDFSKFPNHTQAVKRTVKLVTEASAKFCGKTMKSRNEAPVLNIQSDFHNIVKPSTSSAEISYRCESVDKDLTEKTRFIIEEDFILQLVRLTTRVQKGKQCIGQVVTDIDDDIFEDKMLEKTEGKKETFFEMLLRNVKRKDIIRKLLICPI
ncbi:hypothetical protein TSAR_007993 [Trichomalopsis sarcophagae]|uniref:Uncharacterized protein n=1 Tax=Trichomalopsis sarcophagae TaxID=543379 RepID=A0A232FNV8_9HYME|nr:hypothetical protein TSAR_007993 [Trichomalopsis sarcophagae]